MLRLRATPCGVKRSAWQVSMTRREVASRTGPFPLRTREMVATETPACAATSLMVTRPCEPGINVTAYIRAAYATALALAKSTCDARFFDSLFARFPLHPRGTPIEYPFRS